MVSIARRLKTPAVGLLLALAAPVAIGAATEHPELPDVETAECSICHEEILAERPVVHAAAEECTFCHEFAEADGEMTVALLETEPALCLNCHDDLSAAVELELEVPHYPAGDSCLNCHDPHAAKQDRLLVAALPELCGECHDLEELDEVHGGQLTGATRCVTCHGPHGSDNSRMLVASELHSPFEGGSCTGCHREPFGDRIRLRVRGERLCQACHGDVTEEAGEEGVVHAAVQGERGRAGCLSCHDPHMSDSAPLLLAGGPELCGRCHAAVVDAAGAETGHAAAADDCTFCHRPHASERARLLTEPPQELCANCHDLEPPTEEPAPGSLTAVHLGADLGRLECVACHSPHGTGHPSLLAANLHPPVEDGCDTCHEGGHDELMEGGGSELCLFCHDDPAEGASVPHAALELGSCTDCHNPHASPQEKLVKSPGAGPCADCHDDQVAGTGEVAHGVVDLVGCRACHEPHAGEKDKLLRVTGPELCLSCHDQRRMPQVEGETFQLLDRFEVPARVAEAAYSLVLTPDGLADHPVMGHRTLGVPTKAELKAVETEFEGELSCLTCHDPHKGRSKLILRWNAQTSFEACGACHKK